MDLSTVDGLSSLEDDKTEVADTKLQIQDLFDHLIHCIA